MVVEGMDGIEKNVGVTVILFRLGRRIEGMVEIGEGVDLEGALVEVSMLTGVRVVTNTSSETKVVGGGERKIQGVEWISWGRS